MKEILESLIIGFSIAAIPGPIFFEITRRVLIKNFWSGITISFGDFIGNFFILSMIFFGLQSFLDTPFFQHILYGIGGSILLYFGIKALQTKKEELEQIKQSLHTKNSFLTGLGISISSPIVIAFWISLSGSYLSEFPTTIQAFENVLAISIGFVAFHCILAFVLQKSKKKIPEKYLVILSQIFGIVLIGYALKFFIFFFSR